MVSSSDPPQRLAVQRVRQDRQPVAEPFLGRHPVWEAADGREWGQQPRGGALRGWLSMFNTNKSFFTNF